jgi:hypothetical protein
MNCTCGCAIDRHSDDHPHSCLDCSCEGYWFVPDFGADTAELTQRLRSRCFAYTALILVHTACGMTPTDEEAAEIRAGLVAVARAGHDLVELAIAAKATSN